MSELQYAESRLAYYKAKPPYKGKFSWSEEIAFWQKEVDRLSA